MNNYVLCDSGFHGRNIIQGHLILLNLFYLKKEDKAYQTPINT